MTKMGSHFLLIPLGTGEGSGYTSEDARWIAQMPEGRERSFRRGFFFFFLPSFFSELATSSLSPSFLFLLLL